MPSPQPQPVLAPLTPAAIFAVVDGGGEGTAGAALTGICRLIRSTGFRDAAEKLSLIGSSAWAPVFDGSRAAELHPFVSLNGPAHTAPATPGDLLRHLWVETLDVCFALISNIIRSIVDVVTVVDEVQGFRFFDIRDLLGFVDGTETPSGATAVAATEIADREGQFAGGRYVHLREYLHDMESWNSLSVPEQEYVIGRTRLPDLDFDGPRQLPGPLWTAHWRSAA